MSIARRALDPLYREMVRMIRPTWTCCARCENRVENLEAHHPFKRGKGRYAWRLFIVLPLCSKCHKWVHANERQAREDGWLISPRTVDMYEHEER